MRQILSTVGEIESLQSRSRIRQLITGSLKRVDFLIVGWLDNRLVSQGSGRVSVAGILRLLAWTALFRIIARRIIFVRHNSYPHATRPESAKLAKHIVDMCEGLFDATIIHSGAQRVRPRGKLRHYVPHPLYHAANETGPPYATPLPMRYFIVFGRIAPYKRIEPLMREFPETETLVVCGEVSDPTYSSRLSQIRRTNILFLPGYRPEAEAQVWVKCSRGVIVSHAEASVVVSGTFFYAISLGRPVFAIRTPFLEWIAPRLGPGTLFLADDIVQLATLIGHATDAQLPPDSWSRIQREFGDDAVRASFASLFAELSR